jgi:hypothetical protein
MTSAPGRKKLHICNPGMHPFYIIPDIQYNTGENVKYKREAHRQERGVNKKQSYFGDRNIKLFAQVGANAK